MPYRARSFGRRAGAGGLSGCLTILLLLSGLGLVWLGVKLRHLLALALGALCLVAWAGGAAPEYAVAGIALLVFAFAHWWGQFAKVPAIASGRPILRGREPIPGRLRWEVLRRDGFRCVYCGRGTADGVQLQLDHVQPFSRGGPTRLDNLVTACRECNMAKGADNLVD